jgi:ankyrin repeat protein
LSKAIKNRNVEEATKALLAGANPNAPIQFNETPIFLASESGDLEMACLLLEKGADVHHLNNGKQSALHSACYGGNLEIVKKLLEAGASLHALSITGQSPLSFAFYKPHLDIIQYFVENGAFQINDLGLQHVKATDKKNCQLLCDTLFPVNRPVNADLAFAMFVQNWPAAKQTTLCLLKRLLQDAFFLAKNDFISEIFSSLFKSGNTAAVELLLKKVPSLGESYLKKEHLEKFLSYFEFADRIKKPKGAKAIGKTIKKYLEEICPSELQNPLLSFFLKNGLAYDAKNLNGQTLLHLTALRYTDEYENCAELACLLGLGYPVDVLNDKGQTPLIQAIQGNVQDPIEEGGMFYHAMYLIYSGANVQHKDLSGRTPLDYANDFCAQGFNATDTDNLELRANLIQVIKDYSALV